MSPGQLAGPAEERRAVCAPRDLRAGISPAFYEIDCRRKAFGPFRDYFKRSLAFLAAWLDGAVATVFCQKSFALSDFSPRYA